MTAPLNAMGDDVKTITMTVKHEKTELRLTKGDTFELKMEARGGTGYGWHVAKIDDAVLRLSGEPTVEKAEEPRPGGPVLRIFRFQAEAVGICDLELHYQRPFEKEKSPERTFQLTLRIVSPEEN
jgi:inhibitor of cysteine peptidase